MNEYYAGLFTTMIRKGDVPPRVAEAFERFLLLHERHGGGEVSPDILALLVCLLDVDVAPSPVPERFEGDEIQPEISIQPKRRGRPPKVHGTVATVDVVE